LGPKKEAWIVFFFSAPDPYERKNAKDHQEDHNIEPNLPKNNERCLDRFHGAKVVEWRV
jgi:hypothetical protein